jgi:hypothetical protein
MPLVTSILFLRLPFHPMIFTLVGVMVVETMARQLCSGGRRATQLPCDPAMSHDCRWRQLKYHHR